MAGVLLRALVLMAFASAASLERCSSSDGVVVHHVCWRLSQPAQSCVDLCGGNVDRHQTINGASDSAVVKALDEGYNLHASYFDGLDTPCHTSWLPKTLAGDEEVARC